MALKRRSGEAGHSRKFLALVDDTPECSRSVLYAALRARNSGGTLVLMFVIGPSDFQHWVGVENIMRAEAMDEAEATLGRFADFVREKSEIEPQMTIREGNMSEEIMKVIEEDEDIAIMVLAAGTDKEGPGPLVTALAGKQAGSFPIPITIVPGNLDESEIGDIS